MDRRKLAIAIIGTTTYICILFVFAALLDKSLYGFLSDLWIPVLVFYIVFLVKVISTKD